MLLSINVFILFERKKSIQAFDTVTINHPKVTAERKAHVFHKTKSRTLLPPCLLQELLHNLNTVVIGQDIE